MLKKIAWVLTKIWNIISFLRSFTLNIIFVLLIIIILAGLFFKGSGLPLVEQNSALILKIAGSVVEQKTYKDPFSFLDSENESDTETRLSDILGVIKNAKNDDRIGSIVLDLGEMAYCSISSLQDIGHALKDFQKSGKKIYAAGDYYTQSQYYLAAHADKIMMNPNGQILLSGLSSHRMYFAEALKKLKVTFHIFRVGKFKSAVEPMIRNDMSEEAKKANYEYLSDLWSEYKNDVAKLRNIDPSKIDSYIDNVDTILRTYNGDAAVMAKDVGLVDSLYTRDTVKGFLYRITNTASSRKSFKKVSLKNYLSIIQKEKTDTGASKIAVLTAEGVILDGNQNEGKIGGDSFSALIRKARKRPDVKAIVIRINSGGGSAFASEIIRREIEITKRKGTPVIVSMGSVAASGGYWMSANADRIFASPSTITGSIGIFGAFPTFDKSLKFLGINSDGIGTNKISGGLDPSRPLNPVIKSYLQQTIEKGYLDFLNVVSKGRNIPVKKVDEIAQGRVWSGKRALKIGLIDELGSLNDAVKYAAKFAKLKDYDVIEVEKELSRTEKFIKSMKEAGFSLKTNRDSSINRIAKIIEEEASLILDMNDPNYIYAKCLECRQ